ncbi:Condensin-2 complex subunit H2 like protein [Aduncisulcus paluster]|uniref:Condensin-2 complex subunit H2 like protein n=1 Tax=Aduncisulcus paluster TaxID=2918883 RepID=A0ABQ5KWN6_9EUKA|nr:Condensin-2 complex subunit H2 like protein [Aduncisulcus paluster]
MDIHTFISQLKELKWNFDLSENLKVFLGELEEEASKDILSVPFAEASVLLANSTKHFGEQVDRLHTIVQQAMIASLSDPYLSSIESGKIFRKKSRDVNDKPSSDFETAFKHLQSVTPRGKLITTAVIDGKPEKKLVFPSVFCEPGAQLSAAFSSIGSKSSLASSLIDDSFIPRPPMCVRELSSQRKTAGGAVFDRYDTDNILGIGRSLSSSDASSSILFNCFVHGASGCGLLENWDDASLRLSLGGAFAADIASSNKKSKFPGSRLLATPVLGTATPLLHHTSSMRHSDRQLDHDGGSMGDLDHQDMGGGGGFDDDFGPAGGDLFDESGAAYGDSIQDDSLDSHPKTSDHASSEKIEDQVIMKKKSKSRDKDKKSKVSTDSEFFTLHPNLLPAFPSLDLLPLYSHGKSSSDKPLNVSNTKLRSGIVDVWKKRSGEVQKRKTGRERRQRRRERLIDNKETMGSPPKERQPFDVESMIHPNETEIIALAKEEQEMKAQTQFDGTMEDDFGGGDGFGDDIFHMDSHFAEKRVAFSLGSQDIMQERQQLESMQQHSNNYINRNGDIKSFADIYHSLAQKYTAQAHKKYRREDKTKAEARKWQRKLSVLLTEQSTRPQFDVTLMCKDVSLCVDGYAPVFSVGKSISSKQSTKSTKNPDKKKVSCAPSSSLSDVCVNMGHQPFNVARLFVSTLQLCADGVISVGEDGLGDLAIKKKDVVPSFEDEIDSSSTQNPTESEMNSELMVVETPEEEDESVDSVI